MWPRAGRSPGGAPYSCAIAEPLLLRIEAALHDGTCGAVHGKARPRGEGEHRGPQQRAHARVVQRDVERVVYSGPVALDTDVGRDRLRWAEEEQGLVEQVRAEVEPDARAGVRLFAPGARLESGAEAVEMGFEARDPAEDTFRQHVSQRGEVSRIAAGFVSPGDPPPLPPPVGGALGPPPPRVHTPLVPPRAARP